MGFTLAKFNPLLNTTKVYNIDNFFIATSICLSADKNIWVSTTNGYIEKYNIEKDNFNQPAWTNDVLSEVGHLANVH